MQTSAISSCSNMQYNYTTLCDIIIYATICDLINYASICDLIIYAKICNIIMILSNIMQYTYATTRYN